MPSPWQPALVPHGALRPHEPRPLLVMTQLSATLSALVHSPWFNLFLMTLYMALESGFTFSPDKITRSGLFCFFMAMFI